MRGQILHIIESAGFASEGPFQTDLLGVLRKRHPEYTWFAIETEETEPGFPDILGATHKASHLPSRHIEVKLIDRDGMLNFKKSQPLFYRQHPELSIDIFAWSNKKRCIYVFEPAEILEAKSLHIKVNEE